VKSPRAFRCSSRVATTDSGRVDFAARIKRSLMNIGKSGRWLLLPPIRELVGSVGGNFPLGLPTACPGSAWALEDGGLSGKPTRILAARPLRASGPPIRPPVSRTSPCRALCGTSVGPCRRSGQGSRPPHVLSKIQVFSSPGGAGGRTKLLTISCPVPSGGRGPCSAGGSHRRSLSFRVPPR
jgi:hypothetical protein